MWCLTLVDAHLRRTGRRNARRPCGTLAINTLYRLCFKITNVGVSGTNYSRLLLYRVKSDNGFGCWLKITSSFVMLRYSQVSILQLHRKGVNATLVRKSRPPGVVVQEFWTSEHMGHERSLIADSTLTHILCFAELLTHIDGWPAYLGMSVRSRACWVQTVASICI